MRGGREGGVCKCGMGIGRRVGLWEGDWWE